MAAVPYLPKNAPFTAEDIDVLNQLVQRATPLQRSWLSGFLAGLDAAQGQTAGAVAHRAGSACPPAAHRSFMAANPETRKSLALKTKKLAAKLNFDARVVDMADVDPATVAKAKNLIVYISTWGEGDPPQRAVDFHKALMADDAPRFDGVRFAVLALGDTAYVNFCQTGREIDARLEALGGTRVADRQDLDLDFQKAAAAWTDKALEVIAPAEPAGATTVVHVDFKGPGASEDDDEPRYTAENPAQAEITALINLNGSGSTRETWHAEFAVEDPAFVYKPGDAIGLFPDNDPDLANDLLAAVGLAGNADLQKKLDQQLRHHDALAPARRRLRQAHRPQGCREAPRRRRARALLIRPPVDRPFRKLPREAGSRTVREASASAARPPLFGRLEPQGAPRRSASSRRRRALVFAWPRRARA